MADDKKTPDEYEAPTPSQDELNAINRRVHGLDEKAEKKAKAAAADEPKSVEADKPSAYRTRQVKGD